MRRSHAWAETVARGLCGHEWRRDNGHIRRSDLKMRLKVTRRTGRASVALLSAVLFGCGLAGCGEDADTGSVTAGETVDLAGRTFVSTDVRGHDLVEDPSVTLSFESDRGATRSRGRPPGTTARSPSATTNWPRP
jgi:hypothetical protein